MTGKERMITAVRGGIPDRLPVTIHQWQPYHLRHHMDGMDQVEAFDRVPARQQGKVQTFQAVERHFVHVVV